MEDILTLAFEKLEGEARYRPFVDVCASKLYTQAPPDFVHGKGLVDTGADITYIPILWVRDIQPIPKGEPVLVRGPQGKAHRKSTYLLAITIHLGDGHWHTFFPETGVCLVDRKTAMIGMDILQHIDVRLCNNEVTLKF